MNPNSTIRAVSIRKKKISQEDFLRLVNILLMVRYSQDRFDTEHGAQAKEMKRRWKEIADQWILDNVTTNRPVEINGEVVDNRPEPIYSNRDFATA